jgi:Ca2+/Na+ antiporter
LLSRKLPSFFGLAHISLAFVGLMWVLPFLYYIHAYPITTFYQEWMTGVLGMCALPLLLTARYWQEPQVPHIVLLPIGMLLVMLVQLMTGRIGYFDQLLLLSLYFLFAALLMLLAQRLRYELGLPVVATALAAFLLAGAELNTLAGILQHFRWNTFLNSVVTAKTSNAVYGNTAQPNHFANHIALTALLTPLAARVAGCAAGGSHALRAGAVGFAQRLAVSESCLGVGMVVATAR